MNKEVQPSKSELKEYAAERSWHKQMSESTGFDSYANYSGPRLGDLVVVLSRSRDSEILEDSNFESALEMLGGVSRHVTVERSEHWGCGWIELILVNPKSAKHLKIAYKISQSLKDYPVLDNNDYSERESEYRSEYAKSSQDDLAEALTTHFGLKPSKGLNQLAFELNMECQAYYGNDSCIDIYKGRKPEAKDIERLKTCLVQMYFQDKNKTKLAQIYRELVTKIGGVK